MSTSALQPRPIAFEATWAADPRAVELQLVRGVLTDSEHGEIWDFRTAPRKAGQDSR